MALAGQAKLAMAMQFVAAWMEARVTRRRHERFRTAESIHAFDGQPPTDDCHER